MLKQWENILTNIVFFGHYMENEDIIISYFIKGIIRGPVLMEVGRGIRRCSGGGGAVGTTEPTHSSGKVHISIEKGQTYYYNQRFNFYVAYMLKLVQIFDKRNIIGDCIYVI